MYAKVKLYLQNNFNGIKIEQANEALLSNASFILYTNKTAYRIQSNFPAFPLMNNSPSPALNLYFLRTLCYVLDLTIGGKTAHTFEIKI